MLWLKAGLIIENQALWEETQKCLEGMPVRILLSERTAGDVQTLPARIEQLFLDVLVLDLTRLGDKIEPALKAIKAVPNPPMIIVLNDRAAPESILAAMRAGASEYLYPPLSEGLHKALDRLAEERRMAAAAARQRGRTMGFISVKGGCGATTIACHVAVEIERLSNAEVLLADVDLDSGMVGFLMKAKSSYSILDAARNVHRLDASYWSALVSTAQGKLEIVKAPAVGSSQGPVAAEALRMVLQFVRANYDYVVVDFGRGLNMTTAGVLDEMDDIFLVSTFDLPALHQGKQVIQALLDGGFGRNQLRLILNSTPKRPDFSSAEVQKALGLPVYEMLPNDSPNLYQAYSEGTLLPATSDLAKALSGLASKITGAQPKEKVKTKSALSIF
jgi:pilus assembly protein CpaE